MHGIFTYIYHTLKPTCIHETFGYYEWIRWDQCWLVPFILADLMRCPKNPSKIFIGCQVATYFETHLSVSLGGSAVFVGGDMSPRSLTIHTMSSFTRHPSTSCASKPSSKSGEVNNPYKWPNRTFHGFHLGVMGPRNKWSCNKPAYMCMP